MVVGGAALCAGAFAFSSYAPLRSLTPDRGHRRGGDAWSSASSRRQGFSRAWSAATAAVLIGVVSYSVAGRVRVPPLVVVVSTIVPMLPGLSIYRGLSLLADGGNGILSLMTAAAIAIALASGVIFGEYVAQPLRTGGPPARAAALRPAPGRAGAGPGTIKRARKRADAASPDPARG